MSDYLNFAGPVRMQHPGPPHSPGPAMILQNDLQRSISHPGYATIYSPLQSPPAPYNAPSWQQHLNVEGVRPQPVGSYASTRTPPTTYATPTPQPQTWFQLSTARDIGLHNLLGQFPMNVPLPEGLLDCLSGGGPALGYRQLSSMLSRAYAESRAMQPLPNPSIADPRTITHMYMDPTDFSKVPWTYMDASQALPEPQMPASRYDAYNPDPGRPETWVGGRM
jgi:hypothetical protein